jgi:hypothetical protein
MLILWKKKLKFVKNLENLEKLAGKGESTCGG